MLTNLVNHKLPRTLNQAHAAYMRHCFFTFTPFKLMLYVMILALSKLTSKGRATIPLKVRKRLSLCPGDRIAFKEVGDHVEISRVEPLDLEFLTAQESQLADEWLTAEDEEAYGNL